MRAGHAAFDPTFYPVEEKVGEDMLQRWIMEELRPALQRFLTDRGDTSFVGADQFVYWVQHAPSFCIAPDIYVLPGVDPSTRVSTWKVWETAIVPTFCLEVVGGRDPLKDYVDSPRRYAQLGVQEVVVFDPDHQRGDDRVRWQVYRRRGRSGLVCVERTNGDRVRSRALRCWLRVVGAGTATRLRVATGARGERIVPTVEERLAAAERRLARARSRKRR